MKNINTSTQSSYADLIYEYLISERELIQCINKHTLEYLDTNVSTFDLLNTFEHTIDTYEEIVKDFIIQFIPQNKLYFKIINTNKIIIIDPRTHKYTVSNTPPKSNIELHNLINTLFYTHVNYIYETITTRLKNLTTAELNNDSKLLTRSRNISIKASKLKASSARGLPAALMNTILSEAPIPIPPDLFNSSNSILSFKNCYYDALSDTIIDNKENLFITHHYDYEFDTTADILPLNQSSKIYSFLLNIFDTDEELTDFLKILSTVYLSNRFQKFIFLTGSGSNGKSTLIKLLSELFFTVKLNNETFYYKTTHDSFMRDLSNVEHRHIAYAEELDTSFVKVDNIKDLTGSDMITARSLYEQPRTFRNSTLFLFTSNDDLHFEDSNAIRRRLFYKKLTYQFDYNKAKSFNDIINELRPEFSSFIRLLAHFAREINQQEELSFSQTTQQKIDNCLKLNNDLYSFISNHYVILSDKTDDPTLHSSIVQNKNLYVKRDDIYHAYNNAQISQKDKIEGRSLFTKKLNKSNFTVEKVYNRTIRVINVITPQTHAELLNLNNTDKPQQQLQQDEQLDRDITAATNKIKETRNKIIDDLYKDDIIENPLTETPEKLFN